MNENPYKSPVVFHSPVSLPAKLERQMFWAAAVCVMDLVAFLVLFFPGNYWVSDWIFRHYRIDQGLIVIQGLANLVLMMACFFVFIMGSLAYANANRRLRKLSDQHHTTSV